MDKKSLRVLMLSPFFSPNVGGVETHLDDLREYLQKRGHRVFVITYQPLTTRVKAPMFESRQNLEIRRIEWLGYNLFPRLEPYPLLEFMYLTPMLLVYSLLFLSRYRNAVDVIHAHGLNAAFVAKVLGSVFEKRIVVSMHTVYGLDNRPIFSRLVRWILSSFEIILSPTEKSRNDILAAGISADKLKVCHQWVNLNVFKPLDKDSCKREFGLEGKFVVLFVGRLMEKKGIRLLLNVASNMDSDDIVFVFVGDGSLSDEIRSQASIRSNTVFGGRAPKGVLVKYYNAADIVVVPSLYEEVFGRIIIESLSCGTPVIASNLGGIAEVLHPSVGLLIEPKEDILMREILRLYENRSELRKLVENCRKYVETNYSEKNAMMVEESYLQTH